MSLSAHSYKYDLDHMQGRKNWVGPSGNYVSGRIQTSGEGWWAKQPVTASRFPIPTCPIWINVSTF
ncbi:hypothetical protein PT974_00462 [Cladobotryum mycophilum]|uniref:Uncharacterized protein n=1 Tax=Cladobotryum mycophilum TaxID=491253 RepID=A0ABR0T246_9HYPO